MPLGAIGNAATVCSLLILVYVHTKPAANRWATVKFLRTLSELRVENLLTREQARSLQWPRRLHRARRQFVFRLVQRLMTRAHRIAQDELLKQMNAACERSEFLPAPADCHPLAIEAAALSRHRRERQETHRRARVHKNVLCAGGCGTRYGKRRHDHSFTGGGVVEGGWFCPTNVSCVREPTGEHYCGMCGLGAHLPTIRQHTEQVKEPTASTEDAEKAITNHQGTPEAADERAPEQDSYESTPKPEEQGAARPPTEDSDATPAPPPARNTPENRRR